MTDDEIRKAMLNPKFRKRINDLKLTNNACMIIESLSNGYNTASKIAIKFDLSVQSASARLSEIYKKGYLTRIKKPQESGGYEYEYKKVKNV